jgi:hypothetical protein
MLSDSLSQVNPDMPSTGREKPGSVSRLRGSRGEGEPELEEITVPAGSSKSTRLVAVSGIILAGILLRFSTEVFGISQQSPIG